MMCEENVEKKMKTREYSLILFNFVPLLIFKTHIINEVIVINVILK